MPIGETGNEYRDMIRPGAPQDLAGTGSRGRPRRPVSPEQATMMRRALALRQRAEHERQYAAYRRVVGR